MGADGRGGAGNKVSGGFQAVQLRGRETVVEVFLICSAYSFSGIRDSAKEKA